MSVTINDFSVIVSKELADSVSQSFDLSNLWPDPSPPRSIPPTGTGVDIFASPYPELPECKIGEFQWPANLSRYGRALYLVDRQTMAELAEDFWGYVGPDPEAEPPEEGDPPINDDGNPFKLWGDGSLISVTLKLDTEDIFNETMGTTAISVKMLMLLPIRITLASHDVWLLRLVEKDRFEWGSQLIYPADPTGLVTGTGPPGTTNPAATDPFYSADDVFGLNTADPRVIIRILASNYLRVASTDLALPSELNTYATSRLDPCYQWKGNRVVEVLDTIAHSYGMRAVYTLPDSDSTNSQLIFQLPAGVASDCKTKFLDTTKAPIVSGGQSGRGWLPKKAEFSARRCEQFCITEYYYRYECTIDSHDHGFVGVMGSKPLNFFTLWNMHYSGPIDSELIVTSIETDFTSLALKLFKLHRQWHSEEYYVKYAGFYRLNATSFPSGYDDYISYDLLTGTTALKSLPSSFMPTAIILNTLYDCCVTEDQMLFGVVDSTYSPTTGGSVTQYLVNVYEHLTGAKGRLRNKPYVHYLVSLSPLVTSGKAILRARFPLGTLPIGANVVLFRDRDAEWNAVIWGCQ